jgi:hypothetical protein
MHEKAPRKATRRRTGPSVTGQGAVYSRIHGVMGEEEINSGHKQARCARRRRCMYMREYVDRIFFGGVAVKLKSRAAAPAATIILVQGIT